MQQRRRHTLHPRHARLPAQQQQQQQEQQQQLLPRT
jgi:hypothetical protein